METSPTPHSPEVQSQSQYRLLTAENYLDLITDRQGVTPTKTISSHDSEGMRAKYVENTEKLIDMMRDGFRDEEGPEHASADVVFYLDKSARPVYWLTDAFWEVLHDGSEAPSKPETHFMNLHAHEGPGGGRPERSDMVRQVEEGVFDTYIAEMQEVYPDMAGKNLLVVDEVSVSGSTEELAYQIFRRAFPEAHIKSAAWMQAGKREDRQGNTYPAEIPVWYKKSSSAGRGVTDVDTSRSAQSPSGAQRKGAHILSTAPETPDLEAAQLRREIRQLAQDVRTGQQPIIPLHDVDADRYEGMRMRRVSQAPEADRSLFS